MWTRWCGGWGDGRNGGASRVRGLELVGHEELGFGGEVACHEEEFLSLFFDGDFKGLGE